MYYSWSKEFLEAGKKRLSGDTKPRATSSARQCQSTTRLIVTDRSFPRRRTILIPISDITGVMRTRYRTDDGRPLTVSEVAQRHGQSVGLPQFVGTAETVTDQLLDFIDYVGGDGSMLSAIYSSGAIDEFVDQVVPELQRRGRFRKRYKGTTLREHLME